MGLTGIFPVLPAHVRCFVSKYFGEKENEEEQIALPRLNFAISTYYKGTGLEEILKKLEEYLDNADKAESDITNI